MFFLTLFLNDKKNERTPSQASGIVRSHKVLQSDFIPLIRPKGKGIQPSARINIYR